MQKISMRNVYFMVLALFLGLAILSPSLQAQGAYGSVVGTVTDASGAAVPAAGIALTNLGTNEKKSVQTDASGNYRFVNLIPAQYKLEFEKTSYKRVVQSPVTVLTDATTRIDVSMEVGAVTETVEVTTQAPLLQTESGSLGSQVEGKTVQEMPLNGRNVTNLISLVPGVVPQGSSMGNATMNQGSHTNNAGWGNFQIGGAIAGNSALLVDGAPLQGFWGNFVAYVPTQDAVQEFKVNTNSSSAEFGRFGGGVVEISTKSGSNQFHGSAYEYLRNTVLNSNTWQWNANAANAGKRSKWNQNQYGASVGGPVLKDKAFFFFSWERFALRTKDTTATNVPDTLMMKDSDPSVAGNLTTSTTIPTSQAGCLTYDSSSNRTTIATTCLDPAAQIIKKYFVTSSTLIGSVTNNYSATTRLGDDSQQFNVRGDINLTTNNRLFLRYAHLSTDDMPGDYMQSANGFKTGGATSIYPTTHAIVGDTATLNPTTILDARISYLRQYFDDLPPMVGSDLSKVGSAGQSLGSSWIAINQQQNLKELPLLGFGGQYGLWSFRGMGVSQERWSNTYALSASLTKILSAHTLKFGGEIRLYDYNALPQFNAGTITMNKNGYAKDEWANFLLGDIDNFNFSKGIRTTTFNYYQGYYVTDTWTAGRKLTVNAGVRWELPGTMMEKKDRSTVLLPDAVTTINGISTKGTLALVKSGLYADRGNEPVKHNLFSPRIGLAYRMNDTTVLRAGYAILFLPNNLSTVSGATPSQSPVNLAVTNPSNDAAASMRVSAPLGTTTIVLPTGKSDLNFMNKIANVYACGNPAACLPSGTVTNTVPSSKFPYMQQWNVTVGHQFKGQQSIELGYAGAIGIHLPAPGQTGWGLNQLDNANAQLLQAGTLTQLQAQALRPHPSYKNMVDSYPLISTITYHAFQAKYTKRIGTGTLSSGFTRSKSIGDTDTTAQFLDSGAIGMIQNFNNIKEERSLLSFSIANRWVTSYVIDLPFGKGKKLANNLTPALDRLVSGWAINGIILFQSGQPISLIQSNNTLANTFGGGTTRPNVTAGCAKQMGGPVQKRLSQWFNQNCFTAVGAYSMGSEPRVDPALRAPGMANWDFTAQKLTKITEGTNLSFRVEFFNVFNRRQFAMPGLNVSTASNFGKISGQANNPRQIQAALRFNF